MKYKRPFQVLVVLVMLFGTLGGNPQAYAQTDPSGAVVVVHDLSIWNAIYLGSVSASLFDKWQFVFTESHNFVVTATPITGDLVPLLILLDSNGNEITRATSKLTSTQPAGNYSVQVQPESGSGFYFLTLREVIQTQPSVSTLVSPTSVNVGETAVVTVNLNNVPTEGYTSAEFTCTYDASLVGVSNIDATELFGTDPAVAINGPANGSFIVAIAGSSGDKATTSGAAFTFSAQGLQAGQSALACNARVSKGDNVLTQISSTPASLTILGDTPTPTFTPTPIESATPAESPTPTSTPVESSTPGESPTPTSTPVESSTPGESPTPTETPVGSVTPAESPTPTFTETPVGSLTPVESPTPTDTSTPVESATPTSTPVPTTGTLTGQVLAGKPILITLVDANSSVAASATANPDGTFSLTALPGTYTVFATASGFLSAQGSVTLTAGGTTTLPTVSLPAGDIDNNNVIDPLDAMTIGMNYNAAEPTAADLNNDGIINVLDLELLAQHYRMTGPLVWQ
jgi:carboxypeptidase family protein/cohesin domain-containing protein/dockerin type I repeat protein